MHSTPERQILSGYTVVRVSLADHRADTVPVGVVAWHTEREWYGWRWLARDEQVRGVDGTGRRLMEITRDQIRRWADARRVPYEPGRPEPTRASFWRAVSEILSTAVRLDLPKAIAPMNEPDTEIEALFEAVVQPVQTSSRRSSGS